MKYFQAKSLNSRAKDLSERKDAIDQGVSTLEATLKATDAMETLVSRMKGLIDAARSQTRSAHRNGEPAHRAYSQVAALVEDATYNGLNLLNKRLPPDRPLQRQGRLEDRGGWRRLHRPKLIFAEAECRRRQTSMPVTPRVVLLRCLMHGYRYFRPLHRRTYDLPTPQTSPPHARRMPRSCALEATIRTSREVGDPATNADILKVRLDFTRTTSAFCRRCRQADACRPQRGRRQPARSADSSADRHPGAAFRRSVGTVGPLAVPLSRIGTR